MNNDQLTPQEQECPVCWGGGKIEIDDHGTEEKCTSCTGTGKKSANQEQALQQSAEDVLKRTLDAAYPKENFEGFKRFDFYPQVIDAMVTFARAHSFDKKKVAEDWDSICETAADQPAPKEETRILFTGEQLEAAKNDAWQSAVSYCKHLIDQGNATGLAEYLRNDPFSTLNQTKTHEQH